MPRKANLPEQSVTKGYQFTIAHKAGLSNGSEHVKLDEEVEILYVCSGQMTVTLETEEYFVSEGEALVIPPKLNRVIKKLNKKHCEYESVCFNVLIFEGRGYRRFVQPLLFKSSAYILKLSDNGSWQSEALTIIQKLVSFRNRPDVLSWQIEFHGWIFILWNMIYHNQYINIMTISSFQKLYKRMLAATDYIHEHFNEDVTNEDLSEQVHFSIGTFCRYFKKINGLTPINYLNKYRISRSRILLMNTDKKVSDIALLCGYNNISHFNRDFKKYMKCTPTDYRKPEKTGY
ncbi:MAG: AraC family transcriptional regulator [Ruminococcus sp.]|nr:AraC family transcriptional regulator [Ruminococcus sp.]